MVAAHEDSPHINLKARPVVNAPGSVALLKTIPYGGIKRYQWSNLPMALVGRIDTVDGRHIEVNIGFAPGDPVFVIPDAAPHSDKLLRDRKYTEVFSGEEMNPVIGSIPGEKDTVADEVMAALRQRFNIRDEDLVAAELELVPATQPADVGIDGGLIGSWGQDDKLSAYAASRSIFDLKGTPKRTAFAYITNFEEIGSVNNTGAGSQFLDSALTSLIDAQTEAPSRSPPQPSTSATPSSTPKSSPPTPTTASTRSFRKTPKTPTPPSSATESPSSATAPASIPTPNSPPASSTSSTPITSPGRPRPPKSTSAAEAPSAASSPCATWKSST
jgi:aspartyl aminopeptidase